MLLRWLQVVWEVVGLGAASVPTTYRAPHELGRVCARACALEHMHVRVGAHLMLRHVAPTPNGAGISASTTSEPQQGIGARHVLEHVQRCPDVSWHSSSGSRCTVARLGPTAPTAYAPAVPNARVQEAVAVAAAPHPHGPLVSAEDAAALASALSSSLAAGTRSLAAAVRATGLGVDATDALLALALAHAAQPAALAQGGAGREGIKSRLYL